MARPVSVLELTAEEKAELDRRVRARTTSTRDCLRARIVLLRSNGMRQADVAREVGTSTASVNKWSHRFERERLDGLVDPAGRGRKATISPTVVERVIGKAGERAPGTRRRSTRTTASEVGISASSVSRIWRGHGLNPHLKRTFKLSNADTTGTTAGETALFHLMRDYSRSAKRKALSTEGHLLRTVLPLAFGSSQDS